MTYEAEVVVRLTGAYERVTLEHGGNAPPAWTEDDVRGVLQTMLMAVDRAVNDGENAARTVTFRGISWIVSPFDAGVAIALEIPSGSVIAGPFDIAEARLSALISKVMQGRVN
ncbi:MAG: hypothetical protein HYZ58_08480 [Acidobacteria bacterium]|nr:hypothetical protein [Acidobacteriota bacterium]MBI3263174.1 hypothetical protein [Acidobacteriota bacterium]